MLHGRSGMSNLFSNIYKGKRVLITGHTGFKGSWMSLCLKKLGAEVYGISLEPNTEPNHWDLLDLNIPSYICDIRNLEKIEKLFQSIQPDIIFHLAAQAHVKESWTIPHVSIQTNVVGTLNLLEAIKDIDLKIYKMTFAGSSEEYGNQPQIEQAGNALNELSPIAPISPYGVTKVSADFLCQNYVDAYGIPISIV